MEEHFQLKKYQTINKMEQIEFDDLLQKHIKNLLEISWEYIYYSNEIDNMLIYCLLGKNEYFDNFYEIQDKYVERHKIYLIDSKFIVTDERQEWHVENSMDEIRKIESLFLQYERDVPFEVKVIYSFNPIKLDVKFGYEDPLKNSDSAIGDGFRAWIKSLEIDML